MLPFTIETITIVSKPELYLSLSPRVTVSLSLRLPIPASFYLFLPPIPRPLPDHALRSELTIKLWIDAFTAVIDVQTLTALLTESGFMLVADPDGLPVWMIPALHRLFAPMLFFSRFETGRGLSST
jgi:hypothetical protein